MKNKKVLNHKELASFCKQMAMILDSGLSTMEGISLMMEDCKEDEKAQNLSVSVILTRNNISRTC